MGLQCMTLFMLKQVLSAMLSSICHMPLLVTSGYTLWGLYILVSMGCVRVESIVVCLCVRLAIASGSGVLVSVGLYRFVSFRRRAFVIVVISLPSGAWRRVSLWVVGCCVISYVAVGIAYSSGLMGEVVNVVCLGCQPRGCCLGTGGSVLTFFRVGALFL